MLNKDMIVIFLQTTNLSETQMPEHLYDILIACDIEGGWDTDINRIAGKLTEEHRNGLYRSLLLAWLFDIENFGPTSWGWYKLHESDDWHLLPVCYSELVTQQKSYKISGCHFSPDNMIQFLKDKQDYLVLLETCCNACRKFSEEYRPYNYPNIPINEQINFVTTIDDRVRLINTAVALLR